ncbi:hypothetical protein DFH09DRAFT_1024608 [Mycena vulgaris]|nr:hypothetical protein DFH09DRAFT_1024608 [Mycena vulgaris]
MFTFSPLVAFVAIAPLLVASSPNLPRTFDFVPRDATKLAFDPETGIISVFDKRGSFIGTTQPAKRDKRDTGTCSDLSADDVKSLAGWNALEAAAKSNWGKGSYKLATNIDGQTGSPAQACISNEEVKVTLSGDPSCTTTNQQSAGTLVGTSGKITLSAQTGTDSSTTTTTTQTTDWTLGLSVSAKIGIPDVVDGTTTVSTSVTITNTLSSAVTTGSNQQQTATIDMTAKEGETCSLSFTSKACTGYGTGSIKYVATGWAWFQYDNKVDGHYYWALNMDDILTNEADRTSTLDFKSAISATDLSNYSGSCS